MAFNNMNNLRPAIVAGAERVRNAQHLLGLATADLLSNTKNFGVASVVFTTAEERRNKAANALWQTIVGEKEIASEADQRLYLSLTMWANQEAIRIREQFAGW